LATARIAADMDGYQGLPTSHAIRAYLAVWRFCIACELLAVHVAAGLSPLPAAGMGQRTRHVTAARGALRRV